MKLVFTILLLLALSVGVYPTEARAQSRQESDIEKFEYAHILHMTGQLVSFALWHDTVNNQRGDSLFDLYRTLGGEVEERQFHVVALLNLLGNQGWELVIREYEDGVQQFFFKRRVGEGGN